MRHSSTEIPVTSKLPFKGVVLNVLFYKMRVEKLVFSNSAPSVIEQVQVFSQKVYFSIRPIHHCIGHLKKLYEKWHSFQKRVKDTIFTQKKRENNFKIPSKIYFILLTIKWNTWYKLLKLVDFYIRNKYKKIIKYPLDNFFMLPYQQKN